MVRTIEINGKRFAYTRKWGELKWIQKRLKKVQEAGDAGAVMDATEEILRKMVIGVEGMQDDSGNTVVWPTALDELDPEEVNELFEAILGVQEEQKQVPFTDDSVKPELA